jgi:hypothetical protein
LFLDSDIVVREGLDQVFECGADVAAARNHSHLERDKQIWDQDASVFREMRWPLEDADYVNGGVLYYDDTTGAHAFAEEWHARWCASFQKRGDHRDQPSLNSALQFSIQKFRTSFCLLGNQFNAQFKMVPSSAKRAALWHYYWSGEMTATPYDDLVLRVCKGAEFSRGDVERLIRGSHPWKRDTAIDDWIAHRMMTSDRLNGFEAAWLRREAWQFFRRKISAALGLSRVRRRKGAGI